MAETLIDAQFMKSPLPVLRAARALRLLPAGDKVRLLATDAATGAELRAYCKSHGHALVASSEVKGVYSFTIRPKPGATA